MTATEGLSWRGEPVNRYLARPQKQPFGHTAPRQPGLGPPGSRRRGVAPGGLRLAGVISLGGPLGRFTSFVCLGEEVSPRISGTRDTTARA